MSPLVKMPVGTLSMHPTIWHCYVACRQCADGSSKQSLRQKFKAAMDDCFMLRVLAAALPDPNEDENPCCQ